jgi:hypothetical protein
VIEILVHHPATARFIATKLVRRFVTDDPPPALVKIKTPMEVVASAVRALDGHLAPPGAGAERFQGGGFVLAREVAKLGEPLYEAQPPTGYPDQAEFWVNAGALLSRMNFALGLGHNRLRGTRVDLAGVLDGTDRSRPDQVLDRLLAVVLHGQVSPETRAVLAAQLWPRRLPRQTLRIRSAASTMPGETPRMHSRHTRSSMARPGRKTRPVMANRPPQSSSPVGPHLRRRAGLSSRRRVPMRLLGARPIPRAGSLSCRVTR